MDMDVEEIKEKKIEWVSPTYGTITSKYGVREEIFLDVNPYHTGIDIANKLGTNIKEIILLCQEQYVNHKYLFANKHILRFQKFHKVFIYINLGRMKKYYNVMNIILN